MKISIRISILICLLATLFLANSTSAIEYEITDLGGPTGYTLASYAHGINDFGQVVGKALNTTGFVHAFKWDSTNGMTDLGALTGHINSNADDINNSGQVAGQSYNYGGDTRSILWDSANNMQDLGTLGGSSSHAISINNSGYVAGYSGTSTYTAAYYWDDDNGMQNIGTLGGNSSSASGINDSNQVVGVAHTSSGEGHAFLWDSVNGMTDLGTISGYDISRAADINNSGVVVGQYYNMSMETPTEYNAFIWDNIDGMQALGTLGGNASVANAINDAGQVVGSSSISQFQNAAFIWDDINGMQNLNNLITSGLGWSLAGAWDINSSGQIVGYGDHNGKTSAFLLTPTVVPEPASSILFMTGGTLFIGRRYLKRNKA